MRVRIVPLDRQQFAGRAADRVVVRQIHLLAVLVDQRLAAIDQDLQLPLGLVGLQLDPGGLGGQKAVPPNRCRQRSDQQGGKKKARFVGFSLLNLHDISFLQTTENTRAGVYASWTTFQPIASARANTGSFRSP